MKSIKIMAIFYGYFLNVHEQANLSDPDDLHPKPCDHILIPCAANATLFLGACLPMPILSGYTIIAVISDYV